MATPSLQTGSITPAARLEHVRYAIRDVAVLAEEVTRQGHKIVPLNIGDPLQFDFATPPALIETVARAMRDGFGGYAPSLGVPEALEAIRGEAHRKGIRNVQSVFVTQGVSEAVDLCFSALVNPGENVLTPCPEDPLYWAVLARLGAEPNAYALDEASGWEPDLDDVAGRITPRTRALVVINPNNPTGNIYSRRTLEALADVARRHNLVVFADEIYDKLTFDGEHVSLASLAPDVAVVTFGGLSKAYLAPGWRVGWAIVSGDRDALAPYIDGICKLLRSRLSANHPEQYAIRPALEGPQDHLPEVLAKLRRRRDLTVEFANSTPHLSCIPPQGAFYAFPRLEIPEGDDQFVRGLLREKHVLLVHGSGFGQAPGTRHCRIVFLPDEATLRQAYQAIADYLRESYK